MKPINFLHVRFLLCLSIVWLGVSASATAQDFKTVRDGIEYAELTRTIAGQPVRMNLLRLDLTKVRLDVVHAMDMAIGTETVSSMAKRHGAFAAINAGFFRLDKSIWAGDSAGILRIDGKLLSESHNERAAILIKNYRRKTVVELTRLNIWMSLARQVGKRLFVERLDGIDRERKSDEIVIYTPEFGKTTLTANGGIEIAVVNRKVTAVYDNTGNNQIPNNGYIISAIGKNVDRLRSYNLADTVSYYFPQVCCGLSTSKWDSNDKTMFYEDITNGVPQLIKNGKIDITWEQEKASKSFVETRHPRTAVAKLKDGKFLMVTVDGRSESSGGIGLYDLAALLLEFGATDAMNLDGGGSTTMFLDGKVVNTPSDREGERKVSDAIIVTLRNRSTSKTPVTSRK
jgi:hypothetical protein